VGTDTVGTARGDVPLTPRSSSSPQQVQLLEPGIIFLGRVIELLSGDDYEVYIDKNIFKPLEMHRSYFDRTPYHLLRHRSASYW